jgi:predicted RNase H-like nuclease
MEKGFIGIDGCKVGWAVVEIKNNSAAQQWRFDIIPKIENLLDVYSFPYIEPSTYNKSLINPEQKIKICKILIDIPIGLKESGPLERKCDKDARKFLGPKRGCSVFRVPVRQTAYCDGNYEQASLINFKLTGKKISKQTYHICSKIREVDNFIEKTKPVFDITGIMHESHPEVVFKSLAGTAYYGHIRTLIPATSGQCNGIIRTA